MSDDKRVSRRQMLTGGAAAAAGAALTGQQAAQAQDEDEERVVAPFALSENEKLKQVGGFVQDELYDGTRIVVARVAGDKAVCVAGTCTHAKGYVRYDHEKGRFVCPLHGAEFDLTGTPVVGPNNTEPNIGSLKQFKCDMGAMVFPDEEIEAEDEIEE